MSTNAKPFPTNFRDLGGMKTGDGRTIRRRCLYRSGHLGRIATGDSGGVLDLDFAAVIDLRYADEQAKDVSPWPDSYRERIIAHGAKPGEAAPHLALLRAAHADPLAVEAAYVAFYRALPFDRLYRPLFAQALQAIAGADGPVLIHCTAGKDRTGALVALLLDLLNVPDAAIVEDYMRSNELATIAALRADVVAAGHLGLAKADPSLVNLLLGVRPAYISEMLEQVRESCGSARIYFAEGGFDAPALARLQASLLEGAQRSIDR